MHSKDTFFIKEVPLGSKVEVVHKSWTTSMHVEPGVWNNIGSRYTITRYQNAARSVRALDYYNKVVYLLPNTRCKILK